MHDDNQARYTVRVTFAIFDQSDPTKGFRLVRELNVWTNGKTLDVADPQAQLSPELERLVKTAADEIHRTAIWLQPLHNAAEIAAQEALETTKASDAQSGA